MLFMTFAAVRATTGNRVARAVGFFGRTVGGTLQKTFPQWTYLAEADGMVVGYLTGCPDSRGFAKAKVGRFALPLLVKMLPRPLFWERGRSVE